MATLTIPNSFAADTPAYAGEVNDNFAAVKAFAEGEVIHKDGTVAFDAVPSGPATNPTLDNQFTRKAYVDARAPRVLGKRQHFASPEWAFGTARVDLDLAFDFTMPTLLSGQYLRFSIYAPEFEIDTYNDGAYPHVGDAIKLYLLGTSSKILCYGTSLVPATLGFGVGASLHAVHTFYNPTVELGYTPGQTVNVKLQGAMATGDGKARPVGSSGAPIEFTAEVV